MTLVNFLNFFTSLLKPYKLDDEDEPVVEIKFEPVEESGQSIEDKKPEITDGELVTISAQTLNYKLNHFGFTKDEQISIKQHRRKLLNRCYRADYRERIEARYQKTEPPKYPKPTKPLLLGVKTNKLIYCDFKELLKG